MKLNIRVHALWLASALLLLFAPKSAEAQKALVYCPAVDQSGCTTVKAALTSAFPGGVDMADDGANGTIDLRTADLFQYAVFFVPSLAETDSAAPYARLREQVVAERLKTALIGRRAFWSGTPDQGVLATTRPQKDQLIQNLAAWASADFGTVNAPGLVVLQDNSDVVTQRYSWVQPIVGFQIVADPKLASYNSVRSLTSAGNAILSANGATLAYGNMASFGFQTPSGASGVSLDAVGQTGTSVGGQVVLLTQMGANTGGAVITTDTDDYSPGTPVIMTGSGFQGGETVSLTLHEDPLMHPDRVHSATADGNGAFVYSGFAPDSHDVNVRFVLTAKGQSSIRQAQTTFTDANPSNVVLNPNSRTVTAGNTASYPLSVSFGGNNNSCSATMQVTTALPAGASATFSPHPISGSTSASSTLSIATTAATPAGTYSFTVRANSGTDCQNQNSNPVVTGSLTVNAVVKQNQTITFVAIPDAVFGDSPIVTASASSGLPVTLSSLTNPVCSITGVMITLNSTGTCTIQASQGGDAAFNPATSVSRSFTVSAKALTVSGITASNKVYDGSTTATLVTSGAALVGASGGVTLNLAGAVGAFVDKNVGNAKTVSITGLALSGSNAGNYTLAQPATTANITAKSLTATIVAQSKQYDGTTTATVTPTLGAGVVGGDLVDVAASAANFDTKAVGNGKTVSATVALTGTGATNYLLTSTTATTTADITAKALTGTIAASDKQYDGTTTATVTASLAPGSLIGSDAVVLTPSGAVFDTKAVGTGKTVTSNLAITGADAGNYTVNATATTTASITAKQLTATAIAQNKVYDGNATAVVTVSLGSPSGVVGSDAVNVTASSANFADENVGTGKTVTVAVALSGADATNYSLAASSLSTTADISARSTTISITAQDKEYDGTTAATVAGTSSATIAGDVVTVSVTSAAFNDKNVGSAKPVTATVSLAGADAGNYAPTSTSASTTANITPKALSVASVTVSDKIYDGTTAATITGRTLAPGAIAGDDVGLTSGTASFTDKNVGSNKPVTVSGLALGGADAGNYTLGATVPPVTASITAKAIVGSGITAADKVYDGTNSATVTPVIGTGAVSGDDVALAATGTFADKNVGTSKTVTASLSLTGTDAGNYTLNGIVTATATASITAKALVGSFTANDKVYDGNTSATTAGSSLPGIIAPDVVTLTVAPPTFDTRNVGTGKTVTAALSLGGTDAGNYSVNGTATTTAAITALAITGSITADNKVYDGSTSATIATRTLSGQVPGDAVSYTAGTAAFADKNVGTGKAVTGTGLGLSGADAGNYTVNTTATTTADITVRALLVSALAQNKLYDGTTSASVTLSDDRVAGDMLTVSSTAATFSDKNVGNGKTVTVSGIALAGSDAGNYSPNPTATATANITPLAITGSITANDKVYDGTTAATIATRSLSGQVSTDDVTYSGGSAAFSDKNVGSGKTVSASGLSLSGADANNYSVNATSTTTASITARALAVSATGVNKVYDGTVAATVTLADDRVAGDAFTSAYTTATFGDKNVGAGKPVSVSGISISGADAGNYSPNTTAITTASITPKTLVVSATAANKTYDGNANATATLADDRIAGDVFTTAYASATFNDKNVGSGKAVTVSGISVTGTDAQNYTANAAASATADITARALLVTATGVNKVYDGNANATVTLADDRVPGDVLGSTYSSASFSDKNVGTGKTVSVSGISLSGTDAGNYSVNAAANATADITPRALVVSAAGVSRVYDGTTAATVTLSDDRLAGDVLTSAYSGALFADKNVGVAKSVSVSGIGISGTDAGNYSANATATTSANITALGITGSVTATDKVYDGNTAAVIATRTLSGQVVTDNVSYTGGTAAFDTKNVGTGKTVTATGLSLAGTDALNYTVNTTATTTANITARTLVVSATGINKIYDNNTTATVTLSDDRVSGDVLNTAYGSATFTSKNVGSGIVVTVAGIAVTGGDAGNYSANTSASTTANITPRSITFKADDKSVVWTGATLTPVYSVSLVTGGMNTGFATDENFPNFSAPTYAPTTVVNVGTYTITLGGLANTNYAVTLQNGTLTVLDQTKPIGNIAQLNPVPIGAAATLVANFNDVSTGNSNIVAWKVSYDGVYDPTITIAGTPNQTVTKTLKTFSSTDVVQICVQGQDAGGNWSLETCALLAVYDPSAGFVTGGGWIDSPAGAYAPDPTLVGKANFGFVAKYLKGANVPTGNTEFQFKEGNLNFKSTNFQWLVIQGTSGAQFKGTGTINGAGNYNFLVTANDGDATNGTKKPDSFRIKITNGSSVVYDNKMLSPETSADATILGGGSIQIQSK